MGHHTFLGKAPPGGRLAAAVGGAQFVTRYSGGGGVAQLGRHDFDDVGAGDLLSAGKRCRASAHTLAKGVSVVVESVPIAASGGAAAAASAG